MIFTIELFIKLVKLLDLVKYLNDKEKFLVV